MKKWEPIRNSFGNIRTINLDSLLSYNVKVGLAPEARLQLVDEDWNYHAFVLSNPTGENHYVSYDFWVPEKLEGTYYMVSAGTILDGPHFSFAGTIVRENVY